MRTVRGLLPVVAAVLFVASAAQAGAVAPPSQPTAEERAVFDESSVSWAVTDAAAPTNDSAENDTATTSSTNTTGTVDESLDDGADAANESLEGGGETDGTDGTVGTATASVGGATSAPTNATGDATLSVNESAVTGSLTASTTVDASDAVAVSVGAEVSTVSDGKDGEDERVGPTTPTGTAAERSDENASSAPGSEGGSGPSTGRDGGLPPAGGGAIALGVGAALATALARRSATVAAIGPDVATTLSRLPSPRTALRGVVGGDGWLWRVLGAFGYSRYDGSDPLGHATRADLYELIADSPGTYLSELSDRADAPTSTIRHHLDVLEDERLVTSSRIRGKRRYFPLGAGNEALLAALETDASAAVIEYLAVNGPESVSTIAADLDRDVSTVSHHLQRLAEDGLVERERDGRSIRNRLASGVEEALDRTEASRSRSTRARAGD